jgi:hypothetical protein
MQLTAMPAGGAFFCFGGRGFRGGIGRDTALHQIGTALSLGTDSFPGLLLNQPRWCDFCKPHPE